MPTAALSGCQLLYFPLLDAVFPDVIIAAGSISRPNEFFAAATSPDRDGSVKGAKRRGTSEPLILTALSGTLQAVENSWAVDSRLNRF